MKLLKASKRLPFALAKVRLSTAAIVDCTKEHTFYNNNKIRLKTFKYILTNIYKYKLHFMEFELREFARDHKSMYLEIQQNLELDRIEFPKNRKLIGPDLFFI